MKIPTLIPSIVALTATVAILAGCSSIGSSAFGSGAPGSLSNQETGFQSRPEATPTPLTYVSDLATDDVMIYNSAGGIVGKINNRITGFVGPYGECVDTRGDVFVPYFTSGFPVEYKRGAFTPKVIFGPSYGDTDGCSIDPVKGLLAVSNWASAYGGSVAVYTRPFHNLTSPTCWYFVGVQGCVKCTPTGGCHPAPPSYYSPYHFLPPGYDDKGNLYVETLTCPYSSSPCSPTLPYLGAHAPVQVWELPIKGSSLVSVPVNVTIDYAGGTMWDGKYITLSDQDYNLANETAIYQMTPAATGGLTSVGTTVLTDTCNNGYADVMQPFIVGKTNTPNNKTQGTNVVGGNLDCTRVLDLWPYSAGGNPVAAIAGPAVPVGQSVSFP